MNGIIKCTKIFFNKRKPFTYYDAILEKIFHFQDEFHPDNKKRVFTRFLFYHKPYPTLIH